VAQECLQDLAVLCIESQIAKKIGYDSIIDAFAAEKDRQELIRRWDSERELLRSAPRKLPNSLK